MLVNVSFCKTKTKLLNQIGKGQLISKCLKERRKKITDNLKKDFKVGGESKKLKYCKKKSSPLSFDSKLREKVIL